MKNRWGLFQVLVVALPILVALYFFNQSGAFYEKYLVVNMACLLWLPSIYILLIEGKDIADFGFSPIEGGIRGLRLVGILYLCVLPLLIIASWMPSFQAYYPIQKQAANDWWFFAYFELTYGMYLFCWEFFFRGFILFGLRRYIGWASIVLQALAFSAMHIGKPIPEVIASFAAGVILGIVALYGKSFIPCFILHWASAITFDLLIIINKRGMLF